MLQSNHCKPYKAGQQRSSRRTMSPRSHCFASVVPSRFTVHCTDWAEALTAVHCTKWWVMLQGTVCLTDNDPKHLSPEYAFMSTMLRWSVSLSKGTFISLDVVNSWPSKAAEASGPLWALLVAAVMVALGTRPVRKSSDPSADTLTGVLSVPRTHALP